MSGAGIGPAVAFLYSGPAINVLAITYSAKLLGIDLGAGRAIGAVLFSIVIGLIMAYRYRKEEEVGELSAGEGILPAKGEKGKSLPVYSLFFAALLGILIFASSQRMVAAGISFVALGTVVYRFFDREELVQWLKETWSLFLKIFPVLIVGVFIAGALKAMVPPESVVHTVGNNTLFANFIASLTGALFYFSTLTEVPIIRALVDMGMAKGPALTLLLSGPALSLPSIIVLSRIMGVRKSLAYVLLVVTFSTMGGLIFGSFV